MDTETTLPGHVQRKPKEAFQVVFLIAALLIVPAAVTLHTVAHPGVLRGHIGKSDAVGLQRQSSVVPGPARGARVLVCAPQGPGSATQVVLANDPRAGSARVPTRSALWQHVLHFSQQARNPRDQCSRPRRPDPSGGIPVLSDRIHGRAAQLYLGR
jgi:hypothetical protein